METDQQKLRFLGFLGIFKESFKIIFSWKKIFTQVTLSLILPLSLMFLVQTQLTEYLASRIFRAETVFYREDEDGSGYHHYLDNIINAERLIYWLIKIAYLIFHLLLSLLSTSVVVYTVACNYSGNPITYKKVMSVVPKVWKRVVVTFLWISLIEFAYSMFTFGTFIMLGLLVGPLPVTFAVWIILLILFFIGLVYLSIIWQLATVISVLEESYGISAMIKARDLMQGKRKVIIGIFLILNIISFGIMFVFQAFVVWDWFLPLYLGLGILCLVLVTVLSLFNLVIQTVIYFVCKSYHSETIDKPALADHLEAYYQAEPPKEVNKDVQLEQLQQVYV